MSRQKSLTLLSLAIAAALLFTLAIVLNDLELLPGDALNFDRPPRALNAAGLPPVSDWVFWVVRGIAALFTILLPLALIYMLFNSDGRRRLIAMLITVLLLLVLVQFLQQRPQTVEPLLIPTQSARMEDIPLGASGEGEQPPEYVSNPPAWSNWLASFVVAVVVTALAFGVFLLFRKTDEEGVALGRLAEEAQLALERIEAGADVRQTILLCYKQMARAVQVTRGIHRESGMTPREFERFLAAQGLPNDPVQRLTRLFEDARYSDLPMALQHQQLAIVCLQDIVAACRAAQQAAREAAEREAAARQAALQAAQASTRRGKRSKA